MEQTTNKTERTSETVAALSVTRTDSPTYTFTPSEFARLRIYRAAVMVGFYTDH